MVHFVIYTFITTYVNFATIDSKNQDFLQIHVLLLKENNYDVSQCALNESNLSHSLICPIRAYWSQIKKQKGCLLHIPKVYVSALQWASTENYLQMSQLELVTSFQR